MLIIIQNQDKRKFFFRCSHDCIFILELQCNHILSSAFNSSLEVASDGSKVDRVCDAIRNTVETAGHNKYVITEGELLK